MDPQQAWTLGLLSMLAMFLYLHSKSNDLRYSLRISLLWGQGL